MAICLVAMLVVQPVSGSIHGVHWASDAIAGTIIGAGAAWAALEVVRLPSEHT